MIRTAVRDSFAQWLKDARETITDPVTGEPLTAAKLAKLMGVSAEKVSTWETGRRKPNNPEDVRLLAEKLRRSQSEVLEAIGFAVGERTLTPFQRHVLSILEPYDERPDLQGQAIRVLRALFELPQDQPPTPPPRRRNHRQE